MRNNFLHKYKLKIVFFIFIYAFIAFATVWHIMQTNTNCIVDDVKKAILCEDYYISQEQMNTYQTAINKDTNVIIYVTKDYNHNLYAHLNLPQKYNILHLNQYDIKCKVKANYSIHNFKKGYIWLNYDLSITPKEKNNCENQSINAGGNFLVKLKIKKNNGKWSVIDIWSPDHWCNKQMEHDYWFTFKMH